MQFEESERCHKWRPRSCCPALSCTASRHKRGSPFHAHALPSCRRLHAHKRHNVQSTLASLCPAPQMQMVRDVTGKQFSDTLDEVMRPLMP